MPERPPSSQTRRDFLARGAVALTAAGALGTSVADAQAASGNLTVQQVIDRILSEVPPGPAETVDTVKVGDPAKPVKGIVTTFLASCEVIDRTVSLGANFIITHEPTFYNHLDQVDWLEKDDVYRHKLKLLQDNGIVVWRFHDGIHRLEPDGVITGVLEALGWKQHARPDDPRVCEIPPTSLPELATILRERLGTMRVLAVGDPRRRYRTVGLMVGASGGAAQMQFAQETGVEVLVVGELAEWETSEYVRDAAHAGLNRAALVVGHAASEEPGMKWLAEWMRPRFPGVNITHVPLRDAFRPL